MGHRSDHPKLTNNRSFDLEIHRRCFPAVLFDLILDLLPLVERAQSSTFDCRDVNKDISAPALRLNKSIAFGRIEPFNAAGRHFDLQIDPQYQGRALRPPLSARGRIAGYPIGGDQSRGWRALYNRPASSLLWPVNRRGAC